MTFKKIEYFEIYIKICFLNNIFYLHVYFIYFLYINLIYF